MKFCNRPLFVRLLAGASLLAMSCVAKAAPVVDVLVLYIDAAQNTTAGRDMDARIGSYIAYNNQAFANSGVDMRLRLVGAQKIGLNYTYVTEENLNALRTNSEVARLRQQYGADLVTLINLRQPMSGGYVCGIGYVPPGSASTGTLYNNASSAAFSLVGVDCGLSTFAHELGHNMSMGHSFAQGSEGGVWHWARGHGVQGLFSTIMAYPQSYGTRNQLQQFSNPAQKRCVEQPCGVTQNSSDGADAAANLNNLGQQIAAFMPHVVASEPSDGDKPQLPVCQKQELRGNLIATGEFNSLQGWTTLFGSSRLTQEQLLADCVDHLLSVNNRTAAHGDAYFDLSDKLMIGKDYRLTAKFGVQNASRDTVRVALRIEENGSVRYQYLATLSVTANELTAYSDTFRVEANAQPSRVGIVLYGPQAGVDILADEVALLELEQATATDPTSRTVLHERFEQSASGWSSYGGSRTAFSTRAAEGSRGLRNYSRDYSYSGPIREVTGLLEAETSYRISASVYSADSSSASPIRIWVYYVDAQGEHWQSVVSTSVSTNTWQTVEGDFVISPVGDVTQMRLLVGGPRANTDLYLDDLMLMQQ